MGTCQYLYHPSISKKNTYLGFPPGDDGDQCLIYMLFTGLRMGVTTVLVELNSYYPARHLNVRTNEHEGGRMYL